MAHKCSFDVFSFCLPTKKSQTFMMGVACHRNRKRINCMQGRRCFWKRPKERLLGNSCSSHIPALCSDRSQSVLQRQFWSTYLPSDIICMLCSGARRPLRAHHWNSVLAHSFLGLTNSALQPFRHVIDALTRKKKEHLPYYFLRTGYLLQAIPVHRNKQKEEKLDEKRPSRVITIKAARSISSRSRKKFALLALRPPRFSAQGGSRKNKAEAERPRGARAHQATPGRRRRDSRGYNRWRRKHGGGLVMRLGGATRHGFGTPTPLPGKPSCRGGQLAATWGSPRPCSYS